MKFSTRSTYGLRAMINLAKNYKKGSVSLPSIAREEGISRGYLERIFSGLKDSGLVEAEKGMAGGYKLSRRPEKILVYDIVKSQEGEMSLFYCVDEKGKVYCRSKCKCGASKVLSRVQDAIIDTLKSIRLSDLT